MVDRLVQYPDISDVLAGKAAGRRQRATLSFAEKLAIVDAMKSRVRPIVVAREMRKRSAEGKPLA